MTWTEAEAADRYRALLERVKADDDVVGVVLAGSHAGGPFATGHSDYDVYVITRQPSDAYVQRRGEPVEELGMTLARFESLAEPGSDLAWNRPTFLVARVEVDRLDGGIERLVERIARLAPDEAHTLAGTSLGDYVNSMYRSLKNLHGGRVLAGRLDANESVGAMLTAVFALEGRVRPFNKWLGFELERRPLAIANLTDRITDIIATGDPTSQRSLFRDVEVLARSGGHGAVIDGWEPDVDWIRGST